MRWAVLAVGVALSVIWPFTHTDAAPEPVRTVTVIPPSSDDRGISASRAGERTPILPAPSPISTPVEPPEPEPELAVAASTSNSAPVTGGSVESMLPEPWRTLADCETGGTFNPSIVSSTGTYHGLFQFSDATWQSVGGSGSASSASVEEQLGRAQELQARSGWGQWPVCAAGF